MDPTDLQRYKRLLLEKRGELSSALGETQFRVPAAGDDVDQANADSEAELRFACIKATVVS
jgi:hypothetical protein